MKVFYSAWNLFLLFRRAFGEYQWHIALMTLLGFVSGTLEGIGVTAIIPLFSFIGGGGEATDSISLAIGSFFRYFHLPYTVKFLLLFMVVLFLAKAVFLLLSQQVTVQIVAGFEKKMRHKLLQTTFSARWPFLSAQKVGHLDQTLITEVASSSAILYYLSGAMLVAANLVVYIVLVFNISSLIALLAFVAGAVIFFVFLPLFRTAKNIAGKTVVANKKLAHYAGESIIGSKIIKSMALEESVLERGGGILADMKDLYVRLAFLKNITAASLQLVGVFFIIGLFAFFYKTATFHFASFAVVVYALNKVITNIQYIHNHAHVISTQIPYLASILRYQDEAFQNRESDAGSLPFRFEKELTFKDVSFAYRRRKRAVSTLHFSIQRGEIIGLIGASGAGKTTIVDLLLRLIEPKSGAIFLDGADISRISLKEWRMNVGYMPQDVFLLNDTIENNIRFYNSSLSADDINAAATLSHLSGFVRSLPDGLNTEVGERGIALSGGQRQRIALARVLARKPRILILDEATSALDNESESFIQKSIEKLRRNTTVVIIAHRLSTVMVSDRIITLEEGRIIEEGVPALLLQNEQSRFFKVYHAK